VQIAIGNDAEDAQRLIRLREEVQVRLEEMALIATRRLGSQRDPNGTLVFRPHARETHVHPVEIEIIDGDPELCITWNDDGSIEFSSPCGSPIG
jgi:hypothetical protein